MNPIFDDITAFVHREFPDAILIESLYAASVRPRVRVYQSAHQRILVEDNGHGRWSLYTLHCSLTGERDRIQ